MTDTNEIKTCYDLAPNVIPPEDGIVLVETSEYFES